MRLGYVSWLPDELVASVRSDLRLDEWVMPSHIQIARVLDRGLDAAIGWAPAVDTRLHLQLLWAEPLAAVVPARVKNGMIAADRLRVLVDQDLTSWDAWNQFAHECAIAASARIVEIDDGGITGRGFHDHRRPTPLTFPRCATRRRGPRHKIRTATRSRLCLALRCGPEAGDPARAAPSGEPQRDAADVGASYGQERGAQRDVAATAS